MMFIYSCNWGRGRFGILHMPANWMKWKLAVELRSSFPKILFEHLIVGWAISQWSRDCLFNVADRGRLGSRCTTDTWGVLCLHYPHEIGNLVASTLGLALKSVRGPCDGDIITWKDIYILFGCDLAQEKPWYFFVGSDRRVLALNCVLIWLSVWIWHQGWILIFAVRNQGFKIICDVALRRSEFANIKYKSRWIIFDIWTIL